MSHPLTHPLSVVHPFMRLSHKGRSGDRGPCQQLSYHTHNCVSAHTHTLVPLPHSYPPYPMRRQPVGDSAGAQGGRFGGPRGGAGGGGWGGGQREPREVGRWEMDGAGAAEPKQATGGRSASSYCTMCYRPSWHPATYVYDIQSPNFGCLLYCWLHVRPPSIQSRANPAAS